MASDDDDVVVVVLSLMRIHLSLVVAKSERYYRTFVAETIMIRKHECLDDDNDMWLASFSVVVSRGCSWHASFDPISSPLSPIVARHETCVRRPSSACDGPSPFRHSMSPAFRAFDRDDAAAPVYLRGRKLMRFQCKFVAVYGLTLIRTIMLR